MLARMIAWRVLYGTKCGGLDEGRLLHIRCALAGHVMSIPDDASSTDIAGNVKLPREDRSLFIIQ
jgi:hypothetical protein